MLKLAVFLLFSLSSCNADLTDFSSKFCKNTCTCVDLFAQSIGVQYQDITSTLEENERENYKYRTQVSESNQATIKEIESLKQNNVDSNSKSEKHSQELLAEVRNLAASVKELKNEQNQFVQDVNAKNINTSREIFEVKQKIGKIEEVTASGISTLTAEIRTLASAVDIIKNQLNKSASEVEIKKLNMVQCPPKGLKLTQLANGKSYLFSHLKAASWYDARAFCKENKMQLATPKTLEDINYFHQKAKQIKSGGRGWWLSASDVGREPGDFRWHDGSQLAKNSPLWHKGQPNQFGQGKESCVYIYTGYPAELLDAYCTEKMYFICEVPDWCII